MTLPSRVLMLLAIAGPLAACAGQEAGPGSLFAADTSHLIDLSGENALARPWTAVGLPDEDSRAFILAVDPAGTVKSATVKLPSGNSGVITYGDPDKGGCRAVELQSDFRDRDGKARRGERVAATLCPPKWFGSWSADTVTETAQAQIIVPRTAALPAPPVRRPTKSSPTGRGARTQAPAATPEATIPDPQAAKATDTEPGVAAPAAAPERVAATTPPPFVTASPAASSPPAYAPMAGPEAAPWRPAVQTDL